MCDTRVRLMLAPLSGRSFSSSSGSAAELLATTSKDSKLHNRIANLEAQLAKAKKQPPPQPAKQQPGNPKAGNKRGRGRNSSAPEGLRGTRTKTSSG